MEQNDLLQKMLDIIVKLQNDVAELKSTVATKSDINDLRTAIESKHIENINSDNILLKEIQEIKESIRFVNRRVADTELDINLIKKSTQ